jgi:hypothetical protein
MFRKALEDAINIFLRCLDIVGSSSKPQVCKGVRLIEAKAVA